MNGFDEFMRGLLGTGQPDMPFGSMFPNQMAAAANEMGTAGFVGTDAYGQPLRAAISMGPPMPGNHLGPEPARHDPQAKSPLQRIGEILMRTPNAPTVAPHPLGAGNGSTLSQYLQSRPWLMRGTGGLY